MGDNIRTGGMPAVNISMRDIVENIGDGISIQDTRFKILYQNSAHKTLVGNCTGQYCYRAYHGKAHVCEDCPLVFSFKTGESCRKERKRVTGEGIFFYEMIAVPLKDAQGTVIAGIVSMRDITERKGVEEKLHALTMRDDLTGLYNRRGFFVMAEQHLKIATRMNQRMLVFSADLDNLKAINDTFGHMEGDRALAETARIIRETFRESDIVARIGGDEFVILQIEDPPNNAESLARRLENNFTHFNAVGNKPYALSISTGIAHFEPSSLCSIDELLMQADIVLYEQKKLKRMY